jgi:cytosine permease
MEEKKALFEDYGAAPVPESEQKGWFAIGIVYWGVAVCLPAFLVAGMIAGMAGFKTALGSFIIGAAVLTVVAVLSGIIGARTKLSTALSANFTFGKYGAYILQIVLFFAAWGWFGVQLGFMAAGLGDGGLVFVFGNAIPVWLMKVVGGALMTLTAMIGFKAIEKLTAFAIPLLLIILVATIFSIYSGEMKFSDAVNAVPAQPIPMGMAASIVISTFIMGALIAPDVTRYAKGPKAAGGGMFFGMMIGFPLVLILASIMVVGSGGELDFSKMMLANKSGFWAFLAVITIILAAWTTNDNNLYSGALSINAMLPKVPKWIITVVSAAIGTILALLGINTSQGFQSFLGIIAVVIPPAAAIMILDFFLFKSEKNRMYNPAELDKTPGIRIVPVACWVLGVVFGFVSQKLKWQFTTIAALDTIVFAGIVYFIAMLATKNKIKPSV